MVGDDRTEAAGALNALPVRRAVHFGAGNIGRGFLGELYSESGYHTTFVDVNRSLVELLNERGEYPLRIVGDEPRTKTIGNVSALDGRDLDAVASALEQAEIASTAVGVNVLSRIAPALAAGIERRKGKPLDVIVCENLLHAGPFLRRHVQSVAPDLALDSVGFVEASIGRMVPVMTPAQRAEDPLLVCVEAYNELPVDAEAFRAGIPPVEHLKPIPNFEAYVERKLYVHNAGHAAAAYLGALRGCVFVWQAMDDPVIRPLVEGAMAEGCKALSRRHGLSLPDLREHAADLARRFANRALGDTVARVGADPIRKLGPDDRLIGALRMCDEEGVDAPCLTLAAAAALRYRNVDDANSLRLALMSPAEALEQIGHVSAESEIGCKVLAAETKLRTVGLLARG